MKRRRKRRREPRTRLDKLVKKNEEEDEKKKSNIKKIINNPNNRDLFLFTEACGFMFPPYMNSLEKKSFWIKKLDAVEFFLKITLPIINLFRRKKLGGLYYNCLNNWFSYAKEHKNKKLKKVIESKFKIL